jgi:hypothetical protein
VTQAMIKNIIGRDSGPPTRGSRYPGTNRKNADRFMFVWQAHISSEPTAVRAPRADHGLARQTEAGTRASLGAPVTQVQK